MRKLRFPRRMLQTIIVEADLADGADDFVPDQTFEFCKIFVGVLNLAGLGGVTADGGIQALLSSDTYCLLRALKARARHDDLSDASCMRSRQDGIEIRSV